MPKLFPKVSKRVVNVFWGIFFEKIFLPSVPWRVESLKTFRKSKKNSKFPKMSKIVPKSVQTCLEHVLEQFFSKKSGTKLAIIAHPNAMTDSYTRFLPESATLSQFNDSDTQIQTIYYYITEKNLP